MFFFFKIFGKFEKMLAKPPKSHFAPQKIFLRGKFSLPPCDPKIVFGYFLASVTHLKIVVFKYFLFLGDFGVPV